MNQNNKEVKIKYNNKLVLDSQKLNKVIDEVFAKKDNSVIIYHSDETRLMLNQKIKEKLLNK